ncbi:hypothetical protein [Streptomyces beijiangensis]|uniref:Uncharacterized protein n=1 Tax=Streptomyces beijiangensis TaxID=163361 RepID=A0A939F3W6_9ACTN|nr:hypothetical protein [Streptomyces beijiangensis]MBO0511269.1 hypothetical protein [Streptomyces beijiangensis]
MPTPPVQSPSPDATVIRTTSNAYKVVPLAIVLSAIGLLCLAGGAAAAVGYGDSDPSAKGYAGIVMGLFILAIGLLSLFPLWKGRQLRVMLDATGLWLDNGSTRGVVRWDSLAGAGVHWSELGRRTKLYSLELHPSGPIDRDDPALWVLVRDEEPLAPDLPRLRYRLPFAPAAVDEMTAAVQRYAPQLWLGVTQRASGHIGIPDHKGHAQRIAGRTS